MKIRFKLNGKQVETRCAPTRRLLDVLREDFQLTGSKMGCGEGECGACTVLIDGQTTLSCITAVGQVEGCSITTIEGVCETETGRRLISAFGEKGAVQCGFCSPAMLLTAHDLLGKNPQPQPGEIRKSISGNLCRCTGYNMIIEAVAHAAGTPLPNTLTTKHDE
jgi:carbon-monoxide dehydrogenase small subunit